MSGPTSDGEYLMSIMWIGHSIFPVGTLLKQQGIIVLNKCVFKTFHLTIFKFSILGKQKLSQWLNAHTVNCNIQRALLRICPGISGDSTLGSRSIRNWDSFQYSWGLC